MKKYRVLLLASVACCVAIPALAQEDRAYQSGSVGTHAEMRLTAQENEIRSLNGRIEQMEYSLRRIEQTLQRMQGDMDMRISKAEALASSASVAATTAASAATAVQQSAQQAAAHAAEPAPAQAQTPQTPTEANGTLGALKMQGGKVTGGVNKPQAPPLPEVPEDYGLTAQEQYERAFTILREANYEEAEEAFKSFIEKNPKDKLIDNAKYWYAETLYVRGRFEEAAVAFADAFQQNPKGTKAPDSLLKLGLSLAALKKKPEACVTFSEVRKKYPNASATVRTRANDERTKLKCPTP